MYQKFITCGYSEAELDVAKTSALGLDRMQILGLARPVTVPYSNSVQQQNNAHVGQLPNPLTFVSTYSSYTLHVKKLVKDLSADIKVLTGTDTIIFACRKILIVPPFYFVNHHFPKNRSD